MKIFIALVLTIAFTSMFTFVSTTYGAPAGTIDIRDSKGNEIEPSLNEEIFIVTWIANNYYDGRSFDIEFIIKLEDTGEIVHHNKQTIKLNYDEVREVKEKFLPTKPAKYLVEVKYDHVSTMTEFVITTQNESKPQLSKDIQQNKEITSTIEYTSPLKQFKLGIKMHDIMCQEGLQLVIKSSNEFPACVKPETKQKLIERGWAISDEKPLFVEISLDKFTSAQAIGYPIDNFTIKLEGYYPRPHAPDIQIINETGHVIWTNYDDIGHVILGRISPVEFCKEYQFNDIGGPLTFNKTGTYKFIFTFEEFSLEQEIKILQSTSSISLDKPNFHCK